MNPDRWPEVERLYEQVVALPVDERAAFLDAVCLNDAELRGQVEDLINLESEASDFLERPALRAAANTLSNALPHLKPPDVPGYRIIRELGEGGMGVVYLAEQRVPLQRIVALKLIRPGMDSRHVLARFERERQALARMDHPNIAAVYDAGSTADGRPYFVMEFVDGVSITEYCDSRQLSIRARLSLFIQVCNAVQHAHQKGVIHRDLKPSNVLVVEQDGQAVPKVIDFGTAKSADPVGADTTLTTDGLVFGTVEYMSPEQAAFSTDIDTTTDVYSLGVLLYELLVGCTPFYRHKVETNGLEAVLRAIRDSDPPRPSSLFTRDHDSLASIAARGTDASVLAKQLSGDLDWIVLKALEKDRRRRYLTAASLGVDVQRFLDSKPIEARPPSVPYRIRKFTRRYRGAVAATTGIAVTLVLGLVVSTTLYWRSERNGLEAELQRKNAQGALLELAHRTYAATIAAADLEARSGRLAEARRRLLDIGDAQRNWEWWYLFNQTHESMFTTVSATPRCVNSWLIRPAMSPNDDSQVLSFDPASRNLVLRRCGGVETWADSGVKTGMYPSPPSKEPSGINRVLAVDPESKTMVVVSSQPSSARQWSVTVLNSRTQSVFEIGRFVATPSCADITRDGQRIVLGLHIAPGSRSGQFVSHSFEVWKVGTGRVTEFVPQPIPRRLVSFAPPCHVRFSPEGNLVASSGATVDLWNASSGILVRRDAGRRGLSPQPVAFSQVGERLAIGRANGTVDVFQLGDPTAAPLTLTDGSPEALVQDVTVRDFPAFSPEAGGPLVQLMLVERNTREGMAQRRIVALAFSADGSALASGAGKDVTVWDLRERKSRAKLGHEADVIGVAMSSDGLFVYSSDVAGRLRAWPVRLFSPMTESRLLTYPPATPILVSQSGTVVVGAALDGRLSVLRLPELRRSDIRPSWRERMSAGPARSLAPAMALSADGARLYVEDGGDLQVLVLGDDSSVQATRLRANCAQPGASSDVSHMSLSHDGRFVAFSRFGCVRVWDTGTLQLVARKDHAPRLASDVMFRHDGVLIIAMQGGSVEKRSSIEAWDWKLNKTLATTYPKAEEAPPEVPWRLTQSADGRRIGLLSYALDLPATLSIRDEDIRNEIGHWQVGDSIAAALSPDGSRVATVSHANLTVQLWDGVRGTQLLTLTDTWPHGSGVAFTKAGQIIAGRTNGSIAIWDPRLPGSR